MFVLLTAVVLVLLGSWITVSATLPRTRAEGRAQVPPVTSTPVEAMSWTSLDDRQLARYLDQTPP